MNKLKRPVVWVPLAVAFFVLTLTAGAAGVYFALKPSAEKESFIAHRTVDSFILGPNGFSSKAKQCVVETKWGTLKEGTPVTIRRGGRVVGTGALQAGRYEAELPAYGHCEWDIAVPVPEAVEGEYKITILPDVTLGKDLEELLDTGFILTIASRPQQ